VTLALGFLHAAFLWALPLAAVPVLIHLLNRRRFQRVRWAAMEQLLAAMKRNRRRLRMEQWLLLLLRILLVLLLVFLIARPQLTGSVLGGVRTHHIVLLDDSASMAQRRGATDAFKAATERLQDLVEELAESRRQDLFTLLLASAPTRPEFAGVVVGSRLVANVRTSMARLDVGDDIADLPALFEQARRRVEETPQASRVELYLITDFRVVDWLAESGELLGKLETELSVLDSESSHLTILSVSSGGSENLAVLEVRRQGRVAVVGVPLDFGVEVINRGRLPSVPAELALETDNGSRVLRTVEPLQPGERRVINFTHTFQRAGFYGVTATLPPDRYRVDDSRSIAIEVSDSSHVLLVDGDPGERPEEAETYYLAAALEHRQSGIAVEVIPDHVLADQDLSDVDMIYLCNVATPGPAVVDKLEAFAASGGGIVFFMGAQVDASEYDDVFFANGLGLLPARLIDVVGDPDRPQHVFLADKTHGSVAVATEDLEAIFEKLVLVGRHMKVAEDPKASAKVVLRLGDSVGDPLMLTHTFRGGGDVTLVTTTADTRWTNWPRWPSYLIVMQELHHVAARVRNDSALGPNGTLVLPLDPGLFRPDVVVESL